MKSSSTAVVRFTLMAFGLATLAACAAEQPQSTISRDLVSGVTSSNGGGMVPANFSSLDRATASSRTFDTGTMAYPTPLPQGNLTSTRVQ